MAGFFCITRISGTSHKIGRNFSQDLPHLVTRYQKSHEQSVCGEAETSEGKISVLLCVYKETGETTGRINKSS